MARTATADHKALGDVIVERFAAMKVPTALKAPLADFKKVHAAFTGASNAVTAAKATRDDAIAAVGEADDALDTAVETLAAKMTGAMMGSRKNPFADYSKLPPAGVTLMAYADEVKEVRAICAKVKKAKPAADVAKALVACEKNAGLVTTALGKLTAPQLAYTKSMATRDAQLLTWQKALTKLKRKALAEWFDDDATYKATFAAPALVQAPKHTRAKAAKPAPAKTNGTPATTTTPASA